MPFVLRTGKALSRDRAGVIIHFKPVPHPAFGQRTEPQTSVLRLRLGLDRTRLAINGPGDPLYLEHVELGAELASQDPPAYGRLLLGVLEGDPTLSIRADETEESWRIGGPILEAWEEGRMPLLEYLVGSNRPREAAEIRAKQV